MRLLQLFDLNDTIEQLKEDGNDIDKVALELSVLKWKYIVTTLRRLYEVVGQRCALCIVHEDSCYNCPALTTECCDGQFNRVLSSVFNSLNNSQKLLEFLENI